MQGNLDCKQGSACQPAPSKKFRCTACRLNRCIEVGMSLEGTHQHLKSFGTRAKQMGTRYSFGLLHADFPKHVNYFNLIPCGHFIQASNSDATRTLRERATEPAIRHVHFLSKK